MLFKNSHNFLIFTHGYIYLYLYMGIYTYAYEDIGESPRLPTPK